MCISDDQDYYTGKWRSLSQELKIKFKGGGGYTVRYPVETEACKICELRPMADYCIDCKWFWEKQNVRKV